MRSRDFRKYIIVTKRPNYTRHMWKKEENPAVPPKVAELTDDESPDKTFWLFERKPDGELVGRFSVESAPQWVMEIYDIIVDEA